MLEFNYDIQCYYICSFDAQTLIVSFKDSPTLIYNMQDLSNPPLETTAYHAFLVFSNGYILAADKDSEYDYSKPIKEVYSRRKYGFINIKGEWLYAPKFVSVRDFVGDVAIVNNDEKDLYNRTCVIADMQGNLLSDEVFILEKWYNVNNKLYFTTKKDVVKKSDILQENGTPIYHNSQEYKLYNYKLEELYVSNVNIKMNGDNNFYVNDELVYDTQSPPKEKLWYTWVKMSGYQGYVDVNNEWVYKENIYQFLDD